MNLLHLLTVFLNSHESKVRLHKKPTREDLLRSFNCWIERNFYIICFFAIMFLLICFVLVCFALVGVSATESGVHYNSMEKII